MAAFRVELLLLVLTGTVLLGPVRGWQEDDDRDDHTSFGDSFEKWDLDEPQPMTLPVDSSGSSDGAATSETYNPLAGRGFQVDFDDAPLKDWESSDTHGFGGGPSMNSGKGDDVDGSDSSDGAATSEMYNPLAGRGFQVDFDTTPSKDWDSGDDDAFVGASSISWESSDTSGFGRGPSMNSGKGDDGYFSLPVDSSDSSDGAATSDTYNPLAGRGFEVDFGTTPSKDWDSGNDDTFDASSISWESISTSGFVGGPSMNPDKGNDGKSDGGSSLNLDGGNDGGSDGGPPMNWYADNDGDSGGDFDGALLRSWTGSTSPSSSEFIVVCSDVGFQITLQRASLGTVKVRGPKKTLSLTDADSCGYEVNAQQNSFTVPFTGCNVKHSDGYSLELLYVDKFGQPQAATVSCEESQKLDPSLRPRTSGQRKSCPRPNNPSPPANCAVPSGEQVPCGGSRITVTDCRKLGCCVGTTKCYYPMDECTADQHFVFAIRVNSVSVPLDLRKLVVVGGPKCKPVILNNQVAIYKFKVTECGTRTYQIGETKVFLAEVQTIVKALNLKYGIITRANPLRFMIECRYGKGATGQQSLASVGYMVKTPSSILPSIVTGNGLYGVQLRLAQDETYSRYYPTAGRPLELLLGKPVYLELALKAPSTKAVLIVNYCLAYPRSANNALVLIYEGCANPYDPTVLVQSGPQTRHRRRFRVQAFTFMSRSTNEYINEEIYFMCSVEVCRPTEKNCVQRCFDGRAP